MICKAQEKLPYDEIKQKKNQLIQIYEPKQQRHQQIQQKIDNRKPIGNRKGILDSIEARSYQEEEKEEKKSEIAKSHGRDANDTCKGFFSNNYMSSNGFQQKGFLDQKNLKKEFIKKPQEKDSKSKTQLNNRARTYNRPESQNKKEKKTEEPKKQALFTEVFSYEPSIEEIIEQNDSFYEKNSFDSYVSMEKCSEEEKKQRQSSVFPLKQLIIEDIIELNDFENDQESQQYQEESFEEEEKKQDSSTELPKTEQITTKKNNFFIDQFVQKEETMEKSHSVSNFTRRIHNQKGIVDTIPTQESQQVQCKINVRPISSMKKTDQMLQRNEQRQPENQARSSLKRKQNTNSNNNTPNKNNTNSNNQHRKLSFHPNVNVQTNKSDSYKANLKQSNHFYRYQFDSPQQKQSQERQKNKNSQTKTLNVVPSTSFCNMCSKDILINQYSDHRFECELEQVPCVICFEMISRYRMKDHFLNCNNQVQQQQQKHLQKQQLQQTKQEQLQEQPSLSFTSANNQNKKLNHNQSFNKTTPCFIDVKKTSSDNIESCCICYIDFLLGERLAMTQCTHKFHKSCIEEWISIKRECPLCMTSI